MKKPRLLFAEEIEVRPQNEFEGKGLIALLYKNARCDMNVLDETYGPENWQRKHYECKGNLFCSVGVKFGDEWVWKDDAGAEGNMAKEKSESSDSFKRSCVNWGIGRELYTPIFIWVKWGDYEVKDNNGKKKFNDKLYVSRFECNDKREIIKLELKNKAHKVCYSMGYSKIDGKPQSAQYKCIVCDKVITKKLSDQSIEKYGKAYCSGECKDKDQAG